MRALHLVDAKPQLPTDCEGCGACCLIPSSPPALLLGEWANTLPYQLWKELLDHAVQRTRGLPRRSPPTACLWFDPETRRCRDYEHRPPACREFECGGEACLQSRQFWGMNVARAG